MIGLLDLQQYKQHTMIKPFDYQEETIQLMKPGCILKGGVGSGKTITALFFYYRNFNSLPLYVITTAKKRETHDWERSAKLVGIDDICVDSWNQISKYRKFSNCFFIFDESKLASYGEWTKNFIAIAKNNTWILLSATPGDKLVEYMPIFIANGYYKNKTDFYRQHVILDSYTKYPKIKGYINEPKLQALKREVTVVMKDRRTTKRIRSYISCGYDVELYNSVLKKRWNVFENKPIQNISQLGYLLRRVTNSDSSRFEMARFYISSIPRLIIFYNFNYELDGLIEICEKLKKPYSQWNGKKHENYLNTEEWVYLCHFSSTEAWECFDTNQVLFFSLNYSYKATEQAEGRIDRITTECDELYYYFLVSNSHIDKSILRALKAKKKFNEDKYIKKLKC